MGRQSENGKHEGYVVAYVPRDWQPISAATDISTSRPVAALGIYGRTMRLRELGTYTGDDEHEIHGICVIGYACSCGWRSPYFEVTPLEWSPSIVLCSEAVEGLLAKRWWKPHVRSEATAVPDVTSSNGLLVDQGEHEGPMDADRCGVPWPVCDQCLGIGLELLRGIATCTSCGRKWEQIDVIPCPSTKSVRLTSSNGQSMDVCASHAAHPSSARFQRAPLPES